MNHKGVFFAFFISTCYLVTTISGCAFYTTEWTIDVTNQVPNDIAVHINSTDHDLGNHTIVSNQVYTLKFCENVIAPHFTGYFWWGSKYADLALIDAEIIKKCRQHLIGQEHCYWLVKPDGFYLSIYNKPFPDGWLKKKSWT